MGLHCQRHGLIALAFLLAFGVGDVWAERKAMVIGNSAYAEKRLLNPLNDAEDMESKLTSLGFKVILVKDANRKVLLQQLENFRSGLSPGDDAVFYYAGHGAQFEGHNYLIPLKAEINQDKDLEYEGLDIKRVINALDPVQNGLKLAIFDACRDNPYPGSGRSAQRGLARMPDVPNQTLLWFAASPGEEADDGKGRNGLFTQHLLRALDRPRLKVEDVFKQVSRAVMAATQDKPKPQHPYPEGQTLVDFYFTEAAPEPKPTTTDPATVELGFWNDIKNSQDQEDFQAYLQQFPEGLHAGLARNNLKRLVGAGSKPALVGSKLTAEVSKPVALAGLEPAPTDLDRPQPNHFRDCPACPEMVRLPAGEFMMGAAPGEAEAGSDEQPRHRVKIKAFSIGQYEVTQGQWQAVMGSNPSNFKQCGDNCPVETVSFDDIQMFIEKLNAKTGKAYRLPTEAEWEYAARAGTSTPFSTGDCINTRQANYDGNYDYNHCGAKTGVYLQKTAPVGSYPANPWGLYDMHGNVWEWTCSAYTDQYDGNDRICTNSATARRAVRGGSWLYLPQSLRSADRYRYDPTFRTNYYGFRLAQD